MSNSPPVVDGNLSYDRLILLDISKLPEEFKQRGALPSRQNTGPGVPRIFDWCYRLEKDPSNVGNDGFSWVSWPLAPANQPVNDLAEDASERSSAKGNSPGFADNNICNNPLSSSDNEDDWEAMEAVAPSGGNCTVALDVDTANRLAAAPASASVIADDQVGPHSNSSAGEYPQNFATLADEILEAAVSASEPLSDEIVCPNSEVHVDQLRELAAAEFFESSRDQVGPALDAKRRKRAVKPIAQVGSAENPGMTYGGRRKNANGS
jgi:hypothetical protein